MPVVLTGTFVVILDFFIVNVAIPSMQHELHARTGLMQFVVAGYGLAFAVGLVTGGRLGDLYGRRRLFGIGLGVFTLASAACGLVSNGEWLVVARVVQGIGASLLAPQVLAILGIAYPGRDRPRAFAAYGMTLGLGSASGQLIGGC